MHAREARHLHWETVSEIREILKGEEMFFVVVMAEALVVWTL